MLSGYQFEVPPTRKHCHIYLEFGKKEIFLFTEKEVYNLHKNISHLAADTFFHLLKLSRP